MLPTTANATLNVRCDPGTAAKLRLYVFASSFQRSSIVICRIAPGETTETVLAHFRRVINDDRVQVRLHLGNAMSRRKKRGRGSRKRHYSS